MALLQNIWNNYIDSNLKLNQTGKIKAAFSAG